MGELVPSVLLHGQALQLIRALRENEEEGAVKDAADAVYLLQEVLQRFQQSAGQPLISYEPVVETEPPSSTKSNRFWTTVERDLNLLQQQVDISHAATLFTHNLIKTEVLKSRNANARVNNKLKTLQLYSDSIDANTITFGDYFQSLEFTDPSWVPEEERAHLFGEGYVTLGQEGEMEDLSQHSAISILPTSNGFLGNNHEIDDPAKAPVEPETGERLYTFKNELRDYHLLPTVLDGEPDTWIEYEKYKLTPAQMHSAQNFNFTYTKSNDDGTTEQISWANGPHDGVLRLNIEVDFKSVKNLNSIEYTPYGLEGNQNYPVRVSSVQTSPNGTDWHLIYPTNVWIGTDVNLQAARTAEEVTAGSAIWSFESRAARYVRFYIEQHHPVTSDVGHPYWVDRRSTDLTRAEGPNPPVSNPRKFYNQTSSGHYLQRREHFIGKRWAIGIRDLAIRQVKYARKSVIVSNPLRVGGIVDRVVLHRADIAVPSQYPTDKSWVDFFISPDDGETWFPISRIEDDYLGIPEVIAFNDPLPEAFRERGVAYYNVDRPVTTLRLKVELRRPQDQVSTSPVLKNYVLKVRRR